jgi:hypothetical protein
MAIMRCIEGFEMNQKGGKMSVRFFYLLGVFFAIVSIAVVQGQSAAGEPTGVTQAGARVGDTLDTCTPWMNCDARSPNYTGYCCRCCRDAEGRKSWECKGKPIGSEERDAPDAGNIAVGEATISGIVTRECILKADDGLAYTVAGEKAEELRRNMGKKIEVKGTVQEEQGKILIDVEAYELMPSGTAAMDQETRSEREFASCKGWRNCSPLPPTFTGTCCRECEDTEGRERWDCRVFSQDEYFDLAEWLE